MLNQPDIEKFLRQAQQIAHKADKLRDAAEQQLHYAEIAADEFVQNGEVSAQSCENMVPLSVKITKRIADLAPREGVFRGYGWFFLNEGASEGDGTPCDC